MKVIKSKKGMVIKMKTKTHYIAKLFIDTLFLLCIAGVVTIPFWMKEYQGWLRYDDTVFYPMMALIGLSGILSVFILFTLDRMYKTLTSGDPFVIANVNAFKRIAVTCGIIAALYITKCFLVFSLATVVVVLVFIIGCVFCLTLKDLFERAVEYKEENDLTI